MYIEAEASAPTRQSGVWWKRQKKPTRIFTRLEIEAAYLKSQQMKVEAYKQAQQALIKPFSI